MQPQELKNQDETIKHDEDVQFERDKESAIIPLTDSDTQNQISVESVVPGKEDTLGKSDFPPLSELDKKPKLQDEAHQTE